MNRRGSKAFSLRKVALRDSYLINAFEKEVLYLTSFDTDKLLAGFRETAGLDMRDVSRYPGWESMLIGGHTLGHYMTACVRCCESANCREEDREALLQILKRLIDGLQECQEESKTGFLFGAIIQDPENVELQFDYVEENKTNIITQAWVPWYTMHKLFEGLVSMVHMDVEGEPAEEIRETTKKVTSALADWVYGRTSGWSEETHRTVLGIEYGGMNDCMYDVYQITGKQEHLEAAHAFDQVDLFERVLQGKCGDNVLNNHHANTTIPKFLGALKRYLVTGEERYFDYAAHFWQLVTENHTYITGGNSEWEHFGEDNILDRERTNCNCETCNVYNMQKMTRTLFMITGDVKYADWYENTYLNSILSSQNPETGMTTYFQPMASGYYKVYGERFTKFWCCTGTGMENFSKLQEGFYFRKEHCLIVNQYLSSCVQLDGAELIQEADIPKSDQVLFYLNGEWMGDFYFRLPGWLAAPAKIMVNGEAYDWKMAQDMPGYARVCGPFADRSVIVLELPMQVTAHALPDGANTYGFKYGPVVLSALLGCKDMIDSKTGVDVTIPGNRILEECYLPSGDEKIKVQEGSVADFMEHIGEHLIRQGDGLSFVLKGTNANLTYVPHFSQHKERYGIYFKFEDREMRDRALETGAGESRRIDTVQPGYGQYENDELHNMTEHGTGSVGTTQGGTSRYAQAGGSFSYTMMVEPEGTDLLAMFRTSDAGKGIRITVEDAVLYEAVLEAGLEEYYQVRIPIAKELLAKAARKFYDHSERKVLTFTIQGINGGESAALCQFLYTVEPVQGQDASVI